MSKRAPFDMAAMRRREIERFAREIEVADTDDFRCFLVAWAWHNPNSKDAVGALIMAAKRMGRDLSEAEANAILEEADATPKHRAADALGKYLRLTEMLRTALRIRTIGSIDISKKQRAKRRKELKRAQQRARRSKQGAKTRIEYLASHATSRLKPWLAEDISRRTWYRRRAAAGPAAPKRHSSEDKQPPVSALAQNGTAPDTGSLVSLKPKGRFEPGQPLHNLSNGTGVRTLLRKEDCPRTCATWGKGDCPRTCATRGTGAGLANDTGPTGWAEKAKGQLVLGAPPLSQVPRDRRRPIPLEERVNLSLFPRNRNGNVKFMQLEGD